MEIPKELAMLAAARQTVRASLWQCRSAPFGMPHPAVPSGRASLRRTFSETPPATLYRFLRLGPLIGQQGGELRLHLAPLLPFCVEPVTEVVNHPVLVGQ